MSLPPRSELIDSGIYWLGKIPITWRRKRFKEIFRERNERSNDGTETLLSVSAYTGVGSRSDIIDEGDHLTRASTLEGYKVCHPKDLVMNIMLAWNRGLGFAWQHGIVSPAYSVFYLIDDSAPKFMDYLVRANEYISYFKAYSTGVIDSRLRLYPDVFGQLTCFVPPPSEQSAIASFLDRETSKIDALVEEQKRLIGLLKEKRQAVITRAVTKGLNPDAPTKDSGIKWLGEVPEHWDIAPLKHLIAPGTSITYGIVQAGPHFEGGIPYIRTGDMSGDSLPTTGYPLTSPDIDSSYQRSKVYDGDLVIAIRATVGKCLPVPPELDGANLTQGTAKISPGDSVSRDFLLYSISGESAQAYFDQMAKGATFREITLDALRRLPLAIPPLEEQQALCEFIGRQIAKIDALISEAETAIALLQERRSALISAAVTGKIDVREPQLEKVASPDFRHARDIVAANIIANLAHEKTFGRVKLQKLLYLAEADADIRELQGHYEREAAGPLDRQMISTVEASLTRQGLISVDQPEGWGTAVSYRFLGSNRQVASELETLAGERKERLAFLIDKVGGLDTHGAEAVATLHAAWNDLLAQGTAPQDADIINEVLHNWHPQKQQTFKVSELETWLGWMRRHGIVPDGKGPTTNTGRLFV